MFLLSFKGEPFHRRHRKLLTFGSVFMVGIALFVVKTALVGNIAVTWGQPIEYSQGVAQTTSCSGSTPKIMRYKLF
jgi:hypothetical protein